MPTLNIQFDPTGGTLFEVKYREVGTTPWNTTNVNSSPVNITVPTTNSYEWCVTKICEPGNESVPFCGTANYIPPCATPQFSFASKSGNNITFNYSLQPNQLQFDIEMTAPSGATPVITRYQTSTNSSPFTLAISNIVTGTYRFRMRGVCGPNVNSAVSSWTDYVDVAVVVSPCIKPSDIIAATIPSPMIVDMRWCNTLTYEDRYCQSTTCTFCINAYAISPNNTLTNIKIEVSIDDGANWSVLLPNYDNVSFGDVIGVVGQTRTYRLVATDLAGNVATSNTLKMIKNI